MIWDNWWKKDRSAATDNYNGKDGNGYQPAPKDETEPEPKPALKLVPPVDTRRKDPHYTVGVNDFGDVVLKIHQLDGYGITTLTMNHAAARRLITMLESAMGNFDNEQGDEE